jgi:glycosyltransferase involved in cell wall biosynthesis
VQEGAVKVGITTATFNNAETISRTIESVLNQTYANVSYVIMDGLSTDNTVEIARSYEEKFKEKNIPFTVISEKDSGMYDAINKATALLDVELVGNVNGDDFYEADAVEKMVKLYEKEKYDVAWADLRLITPKGEVIKKAKINKKIWTTTGWCHPTMFATKKLLTEYPYICHDMYDDFDFVTAAYKSGKKIRVLNEVVSNFNFGGQSTKKSFKEAMNRVNVTYGIYKRHGMSKLYYLHRVMFEMIKLVVS